MTKINSKTTKTSSTLQLLGYEPAWDHMWFTIADSDSFSVSESLINRPAVSYRPFSCAESTAMIRPFTTQLS
jgi:hypothetical protein